MDPSEWLKLFDTTDFALETIGSEVKELENKGGPSTRERMKLSKRVDKAKEDIGKLDRALSGMAAEPARYKMYHQRECFWSKC